MNDLVNEIAEMSKGNPGAIRYLAEMTTKNMVNEMVYLKVNKILGTDIYVLCSDICESDLSKVSKLILNCPKEILIDACSRQDYSGKELVKEYI